MERNRSFEIPDLSGRQPVYENGATIGATTNGQAPNIKGEYQCETGVPAFATNAFFNTGNQNRSVFAGSAWGQYMHFDASRSSAVYSDTATGIKPAGVYMNWIIKAF